MFKWISELYELIATFWAPPPTRTLAPTPALSKSGTSAPLLMLTLASPGVSIDMNNIRTTPGPEGTLGRDLLFIRDDEDRYPQHPQSDAISLISTPATSCPTTPALGPVDAFAAELDGKLDKVHSTSTIRLTGPVNLARRIWSYFFSKSPTRPTHYTHRRAAVVTHNKFSQVYIPAPGKVPLPWPTIGSRKGSQTVYVAPGTATVVTEATTLYYDIKLLGIILGWLYLVLVVTRLAVYCVSFSAAPTSFVSVLSLRPTYDVSTYLALWAITILLSIVGTALVPHWDIDFVEVGQALIVPFTALYLLCRGAYHLVTLAYHSVRLPSCCEHIVYGIMCLHLSMSRVLGPRECGGAIPSGSATAIVSAVDPSVQDKTNSKPLLAPEPEPPAAEMVDVGESREKARNFTKALHPLFCRSSTKDVEKDADRPNRKRPLHALACFRNVIARGDRDLRRAKKEAERNAKRVEKEGKKAAKVAGAAEKKAAREKDKKDKQDKKEKKEKEKKEKKDKKEMKDEKDKKYGQGMGQSVCRDTRTKVKKFMNTLF